MSGRPEDRLGRRAKMYMDRALPAPGLYEAIRQERKQSPIAGARLKAQGCVAGTADAQVRYLGKCISIEYKATTKQSPAQVAYQAAMRANGFPYHVIRSITELDAALRAEGVPVAPSMRILALEYDAALDVPKATKKRTARPRKERPRTSLLQRVAELRAKGIFV